MRKNIPPGPPGKFFTGHLDELRRDALALFTRSAREYGDVSSLRFGPARMYLLSHPDLIETVLVAKAGLFIKHFGLRSNRRMLGNGLLLSEGDFWRQQRRLMQPAFGRERVAAYAPVFVDYASQMSAAWQEGEVRDFHADMSRLTLEIIVRTMFGVEVTDQAQAVGAAMSDLASGFSTRFYTLLRPPAWWPTAANRRRERAAQRIDAILFDLIQKRRAAGPSDDLLGRLLTQAKSDPTSTLTDQQLRDEMMTLFLAGHDTTALTLSWGWYMLAQHPPVGRALVDELRSVLGNRLPTFDDLSRLCYTEAFVLEVMRLYPAAYLVGRQAVEPCEIGGYLIPKGGTVLMSQWVVQRDARWFDDPETFRPERWLGQLARQLPRYAYFPFGGGPRICIGNHFAMLEAVLVTATIAQRWRFIVPEGEPPVVPRPAITLRPSGPIRLMLRRV